MKWAGLWVDKRPVVGMARLVSLLIKRAHHLIHGQPALWRPVAVFILAQRFAGGFMSRVQLVAALNGDKDWISHGDPHIARLAMRWRARRRR